MSITLAQLKLVVTQQLQGDLDAGPILPIGTDNIDSDGKVAGWLVNQAGEIMTGAHQWRFLERPPVNLTFDASISIADGTWTNSSLTLTKTAGFADYTHAENNEIRITGGTGATTGLYNIDSKTSDNAIVLTETIGSGADGQTDIDATIQQDYVDMPSDFGQLISYSMDGLTQHLRLTTPQELASYRAEGLLPTGFMYWGTIVYPIGDDQTAYATQAPRIEIYPAPSTTKRSALTIWYRASGALLTETTHYANIPNWATPLLIEYVRAVAQGWGNRTRTGPALPLTQWTDAIERSSMFRHMVSRDGGVQPDVGVVTNGAVQMRMRPAIDYLPWSDVADPA